MESGRVRGDAEGDGDREGDGGREGRVWASETERATARASGRAVVRVRVREREREREREGRHTGPMPWTGSQPPHPNQVPCVM